MNKKISSGKILGIIFCIIAAAATIVLLWANVYFSGQMKLVDKYYTALTRDDFEGFKSCFLYPEVYTEAYFAELREHILILHDNENIHAKTKFTGRINPTKLHAVYYDLTFYNNEESRKINGLHIQMLPKNGKWFITFTSEMVL